MRIGILLIGLMIVFQGCRDFVLPDISNEVLSVNSPSDDLRTSSNQVLFWWDRLEDVNAYHLQIVSPDFEQATNFILDTVINDDRLAYVLPIGEYAWRLRAESGATHTDFQTGSIEIFATDTLDNQVVTIVQPASGTWLADGNVMFEWFALTNATSYRFDIETQGGASVVPPQLLAETSYEVMLAEGSYVWSVRAENDHSFSQTTTAQVNIDLTIPSAPVLNIPNNNQTISAGVTSLEWTNDPSESSLTDSLFIYEDSLLNVPFFVGISDSSRLSVSVSDTGDFYWQVRSVDRAGNSSAVSATRKFIAQ